MKILLAISLIYLIMVEGYKPHFSDEEKEVETRGVKVYTTGGTANGAACVFPFLYKGRIYNSCTKNDHSTYWCSTTYDYAKDYKWGNCVSVDTEPPKLLSCPKDLEISTTKSKERVSWLIPTYSDNCGPTCLIKITSNHRPSDFLQAGKSIDVRYTAEDPSGNKNVACKFTVRIKDVGSPRMLSCPDDIVATTTEQSTRVNWAIPGYSDNYEPSCQLSIVSNFQPLRSKFRSGTTNTVHYVAKDPSGNSNRDCVFTVTVKAPNCGRVAPPKNGMLTEFGTTLVHPSCKRGFYPTQPFPFFYTCKQGKWQEFLSTRIITKVPDCILKTPPAGVNMALYLSFYTYDGDCNSAAAQAQAKQNMLMMGICSGDCSINKLKSNCWQTTV